jgi:hypothetical protein
MRLIKFFRDGFSGESIDASNLIELKKALIDRGAKTFQLCQLSPFDDWHYKGNSEEISQLSEDHVKDLIEGKWSLAYW